MRQLTAKADCSGVTVRSLLKREFLLADSLLSHLKYCPGAVCVNDRPARLVDRVRAGDTVTVRLADDRPMRAVPAIAAPLDILWEDEDLLLVNKPADMAVHGASVTARPTLANALAAYWGEETPFHPVNRLDRGTSGVMAVAKSRYIHDRLRKMLHTEDFRRDYLAVTAGVPAPRRGTLATPVGGKPSVTAYEVLAEDGALALVHVTPATGRTHQIRVHFAAAGTPLVGDARYGAPSPLLSRPALHSRSLTLRHPLTGAWVTATAPLPADMEKLILRVKGEKPL